MIYDSAPLLINYGTTNTSKIMGEYWCGFTNDYNGQSAGNDVNAAATHVIMALPIPIRMVPSQLIQFSQLLWFKAGKTQVKL